MMYRGGRAPLITSPWPLYSSCGIINLVNNVVEYLWAWVVTDISLMVFYSILRSYGWWRDLSREGVVGLVALVVQDSIKLGIALFMLSEVLIFMAIIWLFFHSSCTILMGCSWPPISIEVMNPIAYPVLNTTILLARGVTGTCVSIAGIVGC